MIRRRTVAWAVVALALALVTVLVGRAGRANEQRKELDGIALVRLLVGKKIGQPVNYRVSTGLYCLLYTARGRPFALELCADPYGRIVEAADRRGSVPAFYNITFEPAIATEHIDMHLVGRAINKIQADAVKAAHS